MLKKEAALWAIKNLEETNIPKNKVFKLSSGHFGVPAAVIKREVIALKGEDWLSDRDERMIEKYCPQYAARNRRTGRLCRQFDKHICDIVREDI